MEPRISEFDGARLRQLISAWCDGAIMPGDMRQLEATLTASAAARQMFIEVMQIHAHMEGQTIAQEYLATFVPLPLNIAETAGFPPPIQSPSFLQMVRLKTEWFSRRGGAWAALLLLGVLSWGLFQLLRGPAPVRPVDQSAAAKVRPDAPITGRDQAPVIVARVSDHSDDCQWYLDQGSQTKNAPVVSVCGGDNIRVTNGRMKLTFDNGTVVTLHAPALFQIISDMRARVLLGKVTARVAKGAEGFSIVTPRATVIDLGTEFGLEVNEVGATDLVVFEGAVNFDYVNQEEGTAHRQRLRTGEGMHLDARGTASRIVSITDQSYSDAPAKIAARPPVITNVTDNILRDAWNYYEIVQSGMREDAKAFADREEHEWNGVTTRGMPAYLLGGDYVKTFNNDKVTSDIEISLTLDRAAKLYILFDERIPPPEWLQKEFRDTGDKIGVDEGVYWVEGVWYTSHHPGVGAGVSIDHLSSIWVRDVEGPCSVQLGPTESTTVDINMYGIVAVPVDKAGAKTEAAEKRQQ